MSVEICKETPKEKMLELGEDCKKCGHCCKYSSGFLEESDLENMQKFLKIDEEELKKKYLESVNIYNKVMWRPKKTKQPFGPCIFFEKNICTIHSVKPLMCRIGTCKDHGEEAMDWFYLNYCVEPHDAHSILLWKARLATRKTIKGGSYEELIPDKKVRDRMDSHEYR